MRATTPPHAHEVAVCFEIADINVVEPDEGVEQADCRPGDRGRWGWVGHSPHRQLLVDSAPIRGTVGSHAEDPLPPREAYTTPQPPHPVHSLSASVRRSPVM